jgi:ABC-type amino acid transport system permease subunit
MSWIHYHFDWGIIFRDPYSDWLLTGIKITLLLLVTTSILSLCLGTVLAVMRLSRTEIFRLPASLYVEIVRNIPGLAGTQLKRGRATQTRVCDNDRDRCGTGCKVMVIIVVPKKEGRRT